MFEYFYHEILRNTIIGFGTLFNNILIKHVNNSGDVVSVIKVPIAYGPTQKFLARLQQVPDLNKPVQFSLPRMSFEFVGLTYDPTRKVTTTQTFTTSLVEDGKQIRKIYMPVPYNMQFELGIFTKLNDDMLQIVEQILPYFQPAYTLSIDLVKSIGEKRDIPIILEGISMDDQYEGSFDTRRSLIYTLRFTAKTYLFGPVSDVSKDIIKKVSVGFVANGTRDITYSIEPRALKNYTGNVLANINQNIDEQDSIINVNDSTNIIASTYVSIDNEEMYIKSKSGNTLTVIRGSDNTPITQHVSGSEIRSITAADADLIPTSDDFGFSML
tara:strand:- start:21629 stop:22609 length:981 start_codon:yes stop_codon:yes gene_type:complete